METEEEAIQRIEESGNKPKDWLEFVCKVREHSVSRHVLYLFGRAVSQISAEDNRKNHTYAKLLVDYAKLQE